MQPTRLKSKTLIDNILLNSLEYSSYSGNLLYELSDHLIQFLLLEGFAKERSFVETKMYKRDFDNFNEREFEEEVINGVDWDEICMFRLNEASLSFENCYDTLNFHLDEKAPFKKVTPKQYRLMLKPWISKDILKKCDERDNLLKLIRLEADPVKVTLLRNDYKELRNKITAEKRSCKKAYYAEKFIDNKESSSKMWNAIRLSLI